MPRNVLAVDDVDTSIEELENHGFETDDLPGPVGNVWEHPSD